MGFYHRLRMVDDVMRAAPETKRICLTTIICTHIIGKNIGLYGGKCMSEVRLTPEGIAKYEDQLEYLKTTRRMEIAEQIKIARSFGDLSENAEYDAAKNEQAKNEYDIVQIETMLRNAVIIDEDALDNETVSVGHIVKLYNNSSNVELEYHIVGSAEADPLAGRISNESPVGVAIIGRHIGEDVVIHTPGGEVRMSILEIKK